MKKIPSILFVAFVVIAPLFAENHVTITHQGDSTIIVLPHTEYVADPNQEIQTFVVDLGFTNDYCVDAHIELDVVNYNDWMSIRTLNADSSTISLLGIGWFGINDYRVFGHSFRRIAIDLYCITGATSITSGFTITIHPTRTSNVESMYVGDRLGVGTTTPSAALHVIGDLKLTDNGNNITIKSTSVSADFSTTSRRFVFDKPVHSSQGFASTYGTDLTLSTYTTPRVTISDSTGYVGIGTANPQEMLHVNGYIRGHAPNGEIIIRTNSGTTQIGASNDAYSHFLTTLPGFYFNAPLTIYGGKIRSYLNDDLKLNTFSTTRMTILSSNGNVGIGKDAPQYKLDVAGKIHSDTLVTSIVQADEVQSDSLRTGVIKTGEVFIESVYGADFVFDDTYKLRSLQEVSEYIQNNKHLPELQSAVDMQQNGINMSDFQIQLLQKIEELTLYIIRQEDKISQQEKRIQELENAINK